MLVAHSVCEKYHPVNIFMMNNFTDTITMDVSIRFFFFTAILLC